MKRAVANFNSMTDQPCIEVDTVLLLCNSTAAIVLLLCNSTVSVQQCNSTAAIMLLLYNSNVARQKCYC